MRFLALPLLDRSPGLFSYTGRSVSQDGQTIAAAVVTVILVSCVYLAIHLATVIGTKLLVNDLPTVKPSDPVVRAV